MTGSKAADARPLLLEIASLVTASLPRVLAARHDVTWKPDGSPVTAADLLIEGLVRDFLEARLPNVTFIGEERYDGMQRVRFDSGFVALLDPIDGTENFCSGLKEWGVSF